MEDEYEEYDNVDFPCIICNRVLYRAYHHEAQPSQGLNCHSYGHDGSTTFDPMNGDYITFNICDPCIEERSKRGLIKYANDTIHVYSETTYAAAMRVDVEYKTWNESYYQSSEERTNEIHITVAKAYREYKNGNRNYKWTDDAIHLFNQYEQTIQQAI